MKKADHLLMDESLKKFAKTVKKAYWTIIVNKYLF